MPNSKDKEIITPERRCDFSNTVGKMSGFMTCHDVLSHMINNLKMTHKDIVTLSNLLMKLSKGIYAQDKISDKGFNQAFKDELECRGLNSSKE